MGVTSTAQPDHALISIFDAGYHLCCVDLGRKGPRGKGWPDTRYTRDQFARLITSGKHAGIILYASGIVDIDFDGPNAEDAFAQLFAGEEVPVAPGWQSTRGRHLLFQRPAGMDDIPSGKFYFDDAENLEIRVGRPDAAQQTILPHPDNGRTWIGEPLSAEFPPAELPPIVVERLLAALATPQKSEKVDEVVNAWCDCLVANGIAWTRVENKGDKTTIELAVCPFKTGAQDDGRAALLINHDTLFVGCHCFHAKCAGKGIADFEALLTVPYTGRRSILVRPPEHVVVDQAVRSLAGVDNIWQRGSLLVRVVQGAPTPSGVERPDDAETIAELPTATLTELLSERADYYRPSAKKSTRTFVPGNIAAMVEARKSWPIPALEGLVHAPTLRTDGSIVSARGYDLQTGLYLTQRMSLLPMTVDEAVAALNYLFVDFPFATPAHKSALIAGLLTPFARHAFYGPAPLFLVDASTRGSGKSLVADVVSEITAGQPMARMTAPTDEAEWRKRITALAIQGDPLILIDNIASSLGSAALDAVLTGTRWQDRELSKSRTVTVPISATWFATGNNVALHGDTPRRTLHIRLQSPLEQPELRSDFAEPDLLGYVRRERAKLVSAALTILSGYYTAGRPDMSLPPWGSYEAWSRVVRSAVVWAGWPDPCDTRVEFLAATDTDVDLLRALLDGWVAADPHGKGLTVSDAFSRRNEFPTLASAIDGLSGEPRNALGQALRRFKGRVVGGRKFESAKRGSVQAWTVYSTAV